MASTKRDITNKLLKVTWVGHEVKVHTHGQKISGVIINETKNTLKIKTKRKPVKIVTIIKNNSIFEIKLDNKVFIIDGNLINGRIEKRIKK